MFSILFWGKRYVIFMIEVWRLALRMLRGESSSFFNPEFVLYLSPTCVVLKLFAVRLPCINGLKFEPGYYRLHGDSIMLSRSQ